MTDPTVKSTQPSNTKLHAQSELRLATAMMVDMVDSTAMSEILGPEKSFLLLDELLGIARPIAAAHGGVMINDLGDGFFALFGAPVSIERASLAASRASLEICARVEAETEAFQKKFNFAPQLRIGLAAGEVLLTGSLSDGTLMATGKTVNLAARLQSLADANGAVCSQSVSLETKGWVRLEPLGAHSLKGFEQQIEAFHVREAVESGPKDITDGAGSAGAFVGRTAEIDQLTQWISPANTQHPIAMIVGEAGIGKSRLMAELAAQLGQRRLIVGSCYPSANARPLAPVIEILRGFAGWQRGTPIEMLERGLAPILPSDEAERSLLISLAAGQSGPKAVTNASYAIAQRKALLVALSALGEREDCLIAVEDLHWVDPLSSDVLMELLREASSTFRILGSTRPVEWLARMPYDRIERVDAGPLQTPEIRNIAQTIVGDAADDTLVQKLSEDSEGNPFFAMEILHHIAAQGTGVEAGRIGTIQNIALARFDLLEPATKALLRVASVQGRVFRLDVLQKSAQTNAEEVAGLMDKAEGIIEPDPIDPSGSARFHHILQRDSIYATIPSFTRGEKHKSVAQAIEACAGDDAHRFAGQLAEHYELAEAPHHTVKYLHIAASSAFGLYANESCNTLLERAFQLIEANEELILPEELENVVSLRIRCLDVMDQFRSVIEISEAWMPRLRARQTSPSLALLLALTGKAYCHMTNFDQSYAFIKEALDMATKLGHARAITYAKVCLMRVLTDSGRGTLADVERLYEETREYTEKLTDGELYCNRMFHMMGAYRTEGMMKRSNEINDELEAFGATHSHFDLQVVSRWNRSVNAIMVNDFQSALANAEAGLVGEVRSPADREIFSLLKYASQLSLGMDPPIESFERIHDSSQERGEYTSRNAAAAQLGYLMCAKGQFKEGWRQLQEFDARADTFSIVEGRFSLLHRIEFLLIVCGVLKSGGKRPKLGFGDMLVAIYIRLTARKKIKAMAHDLLSQFEQDEGYIVARAHSALASLAALEGKKDAARESFAKAKALFKAEALPLELDRLAAMQSRVGV